MSIEVTILIWLAIGAGITAGAFLIARSAVQLATYAYAVLEKRLDPKIATRQSLLVALGLLAALTATALVAAMAILALLAYLLEGANSSTSP